ncbi:uncharacterized protein SAPINGB_P000363 [Magnusiomyces paraingens]|uniref:26S proteasome regulatory subunit RPN8 n=1 Tax=Magnusiomyces paraingens TaxID=2606893 RepID=A0A5E8AZ90_9ASCO|nr:uncharacterized protein SAPINGB_P000363 [Saprochaete ingens]VVT44278.1 unnamed protein product [Saprochaete ingens]
MSAELTQLSNKNVTVAPLVLLSVVDHYNRSVKDTKKRVLGVLLGDVRGSTVKVTNSFAVPFEEDDKKSSVWFLDHNYVEAMSDMFKKVNAKEKLIGWYHSGPKLRGSDLEINELFKKYTPNPLLLIVDVQPKTVGIPTDAYIAIEEIKDDGTSAERTFVHIPSSIEAEEAEEIGVEHLLRDIRDAAAGSLSLRITNQLQSLQGLHHRIRDIAVYLQRVLDGELPVNHVILGKLQDVFNLLPNLSTTTSVSQADASTGAELNDHGKAFTVKTNDDMMIVYLSSLVRAIIAFHNLIENKIENRKSSAIGEKKDTSKSDAAGADTPKAEGADGETEKGSGDKTENSRK